ncbi:MAG: peptide chain release factor N(5)-glutamine methyltransferase [Planctomycetes bacterium]|nr:peptide chain release factor N(5)-glutamine methyltransferase [Planctomycetota bacterium]
MTAETRSGGPLTVRDLLLLSTAYLTERGVPHPRREAEWLLADILGAGRLDVYLRYEDVIDDARRDTLRDMVRRRGKRLPLAYVTGHTQFMGLHFTITPAVLSPRPETEVLVSVALEHCPADSPCRFADVGTGSGVVAGVILAGQPQAVAVATDVSREALDVARGNLSALKVADRAELVLCDMLPGDATPFDLIVANLPYVSTGEYETLEPEVHAEPRVALVAGEKGTELVAELARRAPASMRPGGWLLLEIGYNQHEEVAGFLRDAGFDCILVEEDLAGIPRVVGGCLTK